MSTAVATPPETKFDASRTMSETARTYADHITSPAVYAQPDELHKAFAALRANDPLAWLEPEGFRPFWAATKHQDIMEISRQNKLFTNGEREILSPVATEEQVYAIMGGPHLVRTLVQMDDPDHFKFRHLTQQWFLPQNVRQRSEAVKAIAKEFVDKMEDMGGECDFVNDIALYYPLRVIMQILGVPKEDEPLMLKLTQELFGAADEDYSRDADALGQKDVAAGLAAMQSVVGDFFAYFTDITKDRRANPKDDVASVIANGQIDGEPIGEFEAMSYYVIVAAAGHDTTSASTAGGVLAMLEARDQLDKFMADPQGLSRTTVDEAIRWTTPVKHFMRTAQDDYELRGNTIRKGESIMLCYSSGNRDEEVFDDPFSFKVDRSPNKLISFGYGGHMCLGMHLARLEMMTLYEELFSRVKSIELAGEPKHIKTTFVGGPKSVPIRYKF